MPLGVDLERFERGAAEANALIRVLREAGMEPGLLDGFSWVEVVRTPEVIEAVGTRRNGNQTRYAGARASVEAGQLKNLAAGGCDLEVAAPGFRPARWVIDRQRGRPRAEDTSIGVLLSGTWCADDSPDQSRIAVAASWDPEKVTIVVMVREDRAGGATFCPAVGGPPLAMTIDLPEPLGPRLLLDGGRIPAEER